MPDPGPDGDGPPHEVLDLFAVPDTVEALPGGQGRSVRAGDLVLSPGREPAVLAWLNPLLARLAVDLDERPGRSSRDLRIAVPVPARDGSWVVAGWAASRYEPGTTTCRDLGVMLASARLLHAELNSVVGGRPPQLDDREDRWARAERLAFASSADQEHVLSTVAGRPEAALVERLRRSLEGEDSADLGPAQLVHADLAGNVLLDAYGAPVVLDLSPAWRPVRWAEAVCVLDAALWHDIPSAVLAGWSGGVERQAMLRAALFRVLSDRPCDVGAYEELLARIA